MGQSFGVALAAVASIVAFSSPAYALNDPPSQVGRLAFTEGTVSFHDDQQAGWSPAVVNTPLTSGDSIWTEPNARSEVSVAGTRVRMDGATQLNMLEIDDSQTRLQVGQGRIDIKTYSLDPNVPYQVVTPRGTISLRQQGDYYVEAGSTQDATRLGVRSGAAQIQSLNGQTLTVRPGQVGEIYGDAGTPQLRTINSAPPALPASWAARDRQVNYDLPAQYLSAGVTGYEDLGTYGSWSNDSQYGNVWTPRSVPSGWQPYRTGHWSYVQPWGWTWVDEQPWGYAPYHYGRWANIGNRWVWVPPQREAPPVYAPALVAFIGGVELALGLGNQNNAPVGWFPLGPREAYVPSYSTNQDYYRRINRAAQIQQQALDDRWLSAQRREAFVAGQNSVLMNQRFATVVPSETFVRSQPVARAALQVSAAQASAAPVAPVSAPPAPTASVATAAPATAPAARTAPAATPPAATTTTPAPSDPKAAATPAPAPQAQPGNVPVAKTAVADMPTLAKPAAIATPAAPGPKVATVQPQAPTTGTTKQAVPTLVPRQGVAPPELKGSVTPAPAQPAKPGEPPKQQQAAPQPQAAPRAAPAPAAPAPAAQPQAKPEPAKPAEPPKQQQAVPQPQAAPPAAPAPAPQPQAKPEPAKPVEPPKQQQAVPQQAAPPAAPAPAPQPPKAAPPPAQNDNKAPDKGANLTPQRPAPAPAPAAAPPQPPTPKPPNQAQAPAPQPQPQARPAPQPAPAPQQKPDDKKDDKK